MNPTENIKYTLDTSFIDAFSTTVINDFALRSVYSAKREYMIYCTADDVLDFFISQSPNTEYRVVGGFSAFVWNDVAKWAVIFYGEFYDRDGKSVGSSSETNKISCLDTLAKQAINNYENDIVFIGDRKEVVDLVDRFDQHFADRIIPQNHTVSMVIQGAHGLEKISLPIKRDRKFYPELYPCINNPVNFINEFLMSKANVLILTGPAGLAKSALINQIVLQSNFPTSIVFDENVMRDDHLYTEFISKSLKNGGGLMIMEDADIVLQDRVVSNNTMMSRLLNLSDGIVDTSGAKFIFTANLSGKEQIDDALTRPGRCFDVVEFRNLTYDEAKRAADAIGIDLYMEKSEYTVAEIFNNTSNRKEKKSKVGFI